jgi:hypothetical protein
VDFVVVGFGLGALAVLLGLGVRDLGPWTRPVPRAGRGDLAWAEIARRVARGRACRAGGLVATLGGTAICAVTFLALVAGLGDTAALWVVVATVALAALALVGWAVLYRRTQAAGRPVAPVSRATRARGSRLDAAGRASRRARIAAGRRLPAPDEQGGRRGEPAYSADEADYEFAVGGDEEGSARAGRA